MGLNRGFDCNRSLNDRRVVDFCRNGYLKFDGVVPDDVNRRVVEFLDRPDSPRPDEILKGDWFVDAVINNKPILNGSSEDALRTMQLVFQIYCADKNWKKKYNLSSG